QLIIERGNAEDIPQHHHQQEHNDRSADLDRRRPGANVLHVQVLQFFKQLLDVDVLQFGGFHCFSSSSAFGALCVTVSVKRLAWLLLSTAVTLTSVGSPNQTESPRLRIRREIRLLDSATPVMV